MSTASHFVGGDAYLRREEIRHFFEAEQDAANRRAKGNCDARRAGGAEDLTTLA